MINDPSVDFFGNPKIEATIAGLHMKDRHLATLCSDHCQGTVGVSEQQKSIRLDFADHPVGRTNHLSDGPRRSISSRVKEIIRLPNFKIREKYFVQFVVEILTSMN